MLVSLLLVLLGAGIALLERIVSARDKHDFNWQVFWNKNVYLLIVNAVIGVSVIIAVYTFNPNFDISSEGYDITGIVVLLFGAIAYYIWRLLIKALKAISKKRINKGV